MFRARALFCENKVAKFGSRLGRGPGGLPGAILEPFWVDFGAILEPPGSLLGVFFRTSRFSQKMQPFHTKTLIFKVLGVQKWSQNGPQNDPKIELLRGRPPGGPPGAILEAPRRSPEAPGSALGAPGEPQERPRRPKVSPRRPKMSPRRAKMSPRRPKEPQEPQNELREVPGGFRERFCKDF